MLANGWPRAVASGVMAEVAEHVRELVVAYVLPNSELERILF